MWQQHAVPSVPPFVMGTVWRSRDATLCRLGTCQQAFLVALCGTDTNTPTGADTCTTFSLCLTGPLMGPMNCCLPNFGRRGPQVKTGVLGQLPIGQSKIFRRNGWLRYSFAMLITPLDIDGIGRNRKDSDTCDQASGTLTQTRTQPAPSSAPVNATAVARPAAVAICPFGSPAFHCGCW